MEKILWSRLFASYFGRAHAVFFVGKYFVVCLSTTKTTKILPPEKYPLYGIFYAILIYSEILLHVLFMYNVETCDLVFHVENTPVCNETNANLQLPSYGCVHRYNCVGTEVCGD